MVASRTRKLLSNAAADVLPDDAQIHILQGDSDGFDQINEILANHDQSR